MKLRLTQKRFVEWLKSKAPAEIVGESRDGCQCPLVNFYFEVGRRSVSIFTDNFDYILDLGYRQKRRLPDWAQRFALEVDHSGLDRISAARALAIVNGVVIR